MKNSLFIIALFFLANSCNKDSVNECNILGDDLVGEYCSVSDIDYTTNVNIKKWSQDTFLLTVPNHFSMKFLLNQNNLVIPTQNTALFIGDEPDFFINGVLIGEGHVDCATGLIELSLQIGPSIDLLEPYKKTLVKLYDFNFEGIFLSESNGDMVTLSHDANSESILIHVDMDYKNDRDSLLINLKATRVGCSYMYRYEITDSTTLYGYMFYKGDELLFMFYDCLNYAPSQGCDSSNISLIYFFDCCNEILYFEGTRIY